MSRFAVGSAVILGLAVTTSPATAVTILAPGSTWEYTTTNPGPVVAGPANDWTETTGGWSTDSSPFGNCANALSPGCGAFTRDFDDPEQRWAADGSDGDDFWVRTTFDTTGFVLSSIDWHLGVDNGYTLYLNGNLISSNNAEGYTSRWEYTGDFSTHLVAGTNIIAVALEDHGGLTAFDMGVVGDPVPEPATLLLLGTGLTGLALRRRRSS